ncbi:hypothetical protein [Flavobacterium sp.]|uniref:hypothetical protein n=1 Tax=Flavobacterium sp. TaxID=239 RepID=UPI003D11F96F
MKNLFYLASMFIFVVTSVYSFYDTNSNINNNKSNQTEKLSVISSDMANDHEPILKPTKP